MALFMLIRKELHGFFYCREWVEVGDGEIYVQQLKDDLTVTDSEPYLLFKASEAPWVGPVTLGENTGNVTDAPTVYRLENGALLMLWSSFTKDGKYCIGQALSESGNVRGPWVQIPEPLNDELSPIYEQPVADGIYNMSADLTLKNSKYTWYLRAFFILLCPGKNGWSRVFMWQSRTSSQKDRGALSGDTGHGTYQQTAPRSF